MNYFDLRQMTREHLIETLNRLSKSYVPNWRLNLEDPDVGSALMLIFADMYTDVIQKSQQIPSKHYIDFLNLLDPVQKSSKGSKGYVVFALSEGTTSGVFVSEGKPLIGLSNTGENLVFETVEDVRLTPSKIEAIYAVDSHQDCILNLYNAPVQPVQAPFYFMPGETADNLQSHDLILSHEALLNLKSAKALDIIILDAQNQVRLQSTLSFLSQPENAVWQYKRAGTWVAFDTVELLADGIRLSNNSSEENTICLETPNIRLQLLKAKGLLCDELLLRPVASMIAPDVLYNNELQISQPNGYPFGTQFYTYDAFYIGSDEVFSKAGSLVTVELDFVIDPVETPYDIPPPQIKWKSVLRKMDLQEVPTKKIVITDLILEYWNGVGWSTLEAVAFERQMFSVEVEAMYHQVIQFYCPNDLMRTTVGAANNAWIRLRIAKVDNAYALLGHYYAPKLKRINLSYCYEKGISPESGIRHEFLKTYELRLQESPIKLFNDYGNLEGKGLYMCFSSPLTGGPLKLLFSIGTMIQEQQAHFRWQILKSQAGRFRWVDLEVVDETHHLSETGLVTFIGDEDHAKAALFDASGYWIRALEVNAGGLPIKINSLYMNAVKVVQKETLMSQYFDLRRHEYSKCFDLDHQHLESMTVWVNEKNLTDQELKALNLPYDKKVTADGLVEAIWVKWQPYDDFALMNADTRGYVANAFEGTLTFGDSIRGYLPDGTIDKNVRVDYDVNLGENGNVSPMAVQSLAESVPNVNKVFNPIGFYGGKAPESRQDALKRVSASLRHKERAKSIGDFDALIQATDYDISEVMTLPNRNAEGKMEMGTVTSAILTKKRVSDQDYFRGLKQKIYSQMLEKLPCTLIPGKTFFVVEPQLVSIEVNFKGSIDRIEDYLTVYKTVEEQINHYLHYETGNQKGSGWHMGDLPSEQYLLSKVQGIRGLKSVDLLIMNAVIQEGYDSKEVSFKQLRSHPFIVIQEGQHTITLSL